MVASPGGQLALCSQQYCLLPCAALHCDVSAVLQLLRVFGVSQSQVEREFSETMAMEV
jgi:hypothetical protein